MTAQTPIVNAGLKYCNGMEIIWVSDFVFSVQAGAARDSGNTNDIVLDAPVLVNAKAVGANGVDVGATTGQALFSNSVYAVYAIGDSTGYSPTAALLSISNSQPSLPSGYDMFRRVGWISTDDTASPGTKLRQWWQYGAGEERTYAFKDTITVLSSGASATYAAVQLGAGIAPTLNWTAVPSVGPQVVRQAILNVTLSAGQTVDIMPYSLALVGQAAPRAPVLLRNGGTSDTTYTVTVPTALNANVVSIVYKVTGASVTMYVAGFVDVLE